MIESRIIGLNILNRVQEKLTPFKKPKNKGGSPIGVSEPPMLETKNIKNIIKCVLFFLQELALISGLMSNIDAPVVPIIEANIVPTINKIVLVLGFPDKFPEISIPPEIVYKANNNIINGKNSFCFRMLA
mgnify:CR=1 FL=1